MILKEWNVVPKFYNVNAQMTQYCLKKNGRYCTKISIYCIFCTYAQIFDFFQHGMRFVKLECCINVALQYFSWAVVFWRARFYFCLIIVFPTTNQHTFFCLLTTLNDGFSLLEVSQSIVFIWIYIVTSFVCSFSVVTWTVLSSGASLVCD